MALRSQLQIQSAQYGQTDAELAGGPACRACHGTGQNQFDAHLECMHFAHDVLYSPPDHLATYMLR